VTTEQWILYALSILSAIGGSIFAVIKLVLPRLLEAQLERQKAELSDRQDTREFHQTTEGDAFKQTLLINDKLISVLVDNLRKNELLLEEWGHTLKPFLARLDTHLEIGNRELTRLQEVLQDIDLMYHELHDKVD